MFDLSSIKALQTLVVEFKDGDGVPYSDEKGNPIGMEVLGATTVEHRKARERWVSALQADARKPKEKQDPKLPEKAGLEYLRAVCVGPVNFKIGEAKGKEAVEIFLTDPDYKLLFDQLYARVLNTDNFLPKA